MVVESTIINNVVVIAADKTRNVKGLVALFILGYFMAESCSYYYHYPGFGFTDYVLCSSQLQLILDSIHLKRSDLTQQHQIFFIRVVARHESSKVTVIDANTVLADSVRGGTNDWHIVHSVH